MPGVPEGGEGAGGPGVSMGQGAGWGSQGAGGGGPGCGVGLGWGVRVQGKGSGCRVGQCAEKGVSGWGVGQGRGWARVGVFRVRGEPGCRGGGVRGAGSARVWGGAR